VETAAGNARRALPAGDTIPAQAHSRNGKLFALVRGAAERRLVPVGHTGARQWQRFDTGPPPRP
jgi:hypothetical protein